MQRFAAQKEFVNSEKTRSAAAEEGCTNNISCKQQTSEGVDLHISSTTVA